MLSLMLALKGGGAVLGLGGAGYGVLAKRKQLKNEKRVEILIEEARKGRFPNHFTKQEITLAIKGYIRPSCSSADPANAEDEGYLSDIRMPVFSYTDTAIFESGQRTYTLILADTGMGKTSFCIAYREHLLETRPDQDVAVISLAHPDALRDIERIKNKSECVILLDALDEDKEAIIDVRKRLETILTASIDFQAVIITCRSQFFADDHAIPVETPIRKLAPRAIGQNSVASLKRFYLSPFDKQQVKTYINRHFPIWALHKRAQRSRAFKLTSDIPELAARPMLLERLPEIARGRDSLRELYQLYDFMITGWAHRERSWIAEEKLLAVSQEIAVSSFAREGRRAERLSKQDLQSIADALIQNDPDWDHLQTRSLLNRDSNGLFKFAHLSILEFFVVRAAIAGDKRALLWPWSEFMRQLFISWGYYRHTPEDLAIAKGLLTSEEATGSILPLADYWALPPKAGMPNFKLSATRRLDEKGTGRLAIPQWRAAAIWVSKDNNDIVVEDREFYLKWHASLGTSGDDGTVLMSLLHVQQIAERTPRLRLPSYDEFISLVEGLDSVGQSKLLGDQILFPISDKPGEKRHLLVSLGKVKDIPTLAKVLDRERSVSATDRIINCYETGIAVDARYASKISVQPWWIDEI